MATPILKDRLGVWDTSRRRGERAVAGGVKIVPMSTLPPEPPRGPEGPETADSLSVDVLEREQEQHSPGDDERYAHYVRKEKITESALSGQPVVALCGKVWTPSRDPERYPVCPTCKAIRDELGKQGSSWPFGPDVPGNGK